MEKGYYKDPKTGEITKGGFEDAWNKFMTSKVYDADEEFEDAKEDDRLSKHPEREIIKKIQTMMAKEKESK